MTKTMDNMSYIDIVFEGICKGCRHADLELESAESYCEETFWGVRCNHAKACEAAWEKALREAERRTDEAGRTD